MGADGQQRHRSTQSMTEGNGPLRRRLSTPKLSDLRGESD
jgi:hypothetical protein